VALAVVALGSNLGDRAATLREALRRLADAGGIEAKSPLYETDPIGPPQPCYLNAVVLLRTELNPERLLAALRRIESDLGRERRERWGPRTLDLDLVSYEGLVRDDPALRLPHPEAHRRAFVLRPLCDVAPEFEIPGRGTARALLDALSEAERAGVRRCADRW